MFTSGQRERVRACRNLTWSAAPAAEPSTATAEKPPVVGAFGTLAAMFSTAADRKPAVRKRRARTFGWKSGSRPRTRACTDLLERTPAGRTI
jgi:hypothetical protein